MRTSQVSCHTLYRLWNAAHELLYVGITDDPQTRWRAHRRQKSWWHEVAYQTFEHHNSRAELEAAEIVAIKAERPLYNIAHSWSTPAAAATPCCVKPAGSVGTIVLLRQVHEPAGHEQPSLTELERLARTPGLVLERGLIASLGTNGRDSVGIRPTKWYVNLQVSPPDPKRHRKAGSISISISLQRWQELEGQTQTRRAS